MKELQYELDRLLKQTGANKALIGITKNENENSPFSTECKILAYLIDKQAITYDKYLELNKDFTKRNQYLHLFNMSPRTFGETWGEKQILELFPEFTKATKKNISTLYPNFDGEFDLWIDGVRVEVKACRANNKKTGKNLACRAYSHREAATNSFKYHYQQLKPSCCDVFIWIGVCRDELLYWVLTSDELRNTGKFCAQHRNENTGIADAEIFEGQVFMTEEELHPFLVKEKDVLNVVREKSIRTKN